MRLHEPSESSERDARQIVREHMVRLERERPSSVAHNTVATTLSHRELSQANGRIRDDLGIQLRVWQIEHVREMPLGISRLSELLVSRTELVLQIGIPRCVRRSLEQQR